MLTVYKVPPELVVLAWLKRNVPLSGLSDRQIDPSIELGHPMFPEGTSGQGKTTTLPKICVEWIRDKRTEVMGEAFEEFRPGKIWKQRLQALKDIPRHERAASDQTIDDLTRAEYVQSFSHIIESEIIISGFADGGAGRHTMRSMYETVDSMLSAMLHDITQAFGIQMRYGGDHPVNISPDNFAGNPWGFEIPILLTQMRRIFRAKPELAFTDITEFDISLEGSRTVFRTEGLFDFNAG